MRRGNFTKKKKKTTEDLSLSLSCVKNCLKKIMAMVGYWQLTYDTFNYLGIGWIHEVEVAQLS